MLYLYHGTDRKKVTESAWRVLEGLQKRVPHAHMVQLNNESDADMHELLHATGLFYPKHIVVCTDVLQNATLKEWILKHAKDMGESEHVFLLKEEKILAADLKKLTKHAAKVEKHEVVKEKKESGDVFALANSFVAKKRMQAWLQYRKALQSGSPPEAIAGMLFWKVKDARLKGRRGALTDEEVDTYIARLAELPHESRRKGVELEYALEHFLLTE